MHAHALRRVGAVLLVPLTALALVIGQTALRAGAADHLDAPTVKADHRIDINDVYVFEGSNPANTVLALTTNVAAGILSGTTFRPDAVYEFKVDSGDGDVVENWSIRFKFGEVRGDGTQPINVQRADGAGNPTQGGGGKLIGKGRTGSAFAIDGGGTAWAGLADDPFYFDLARFQAFKATLLAGGGLADLGGLVDCTRTGPAPTNFFAGFNTTAIVLEVPDAALGGGTIRVWAETAIDTGSGLTQVERMGLPTINTVFNHTDVTKEAYNRAEPSGDVANYSDDVAGVVALITSLAGTAADPAAYGAAIASVLLPDVITYNTAAPANFAALNGRALNDDVIDVALSVVANTPLSDCVAEDNTLNPAFPYLGSPN